MDIVDFCLAWEQGDLIINDKNQLLQFVDFAKTLAKSQGKYSRLFEMLQQFADDENIQYPIII